MVHKNWRRSRLCLCSKPMAIKATTSSLITATNHLSTWDKASSPCQCKFSSQVTNPKINNTTNPNPNNGKSLKLPSHSLCIWIMVLCPKCNNKCGNSSSSSNQCMSNKCKPSVGSKWNRRTARLLNHTKSSSLLPVWTTSKHCKVSSRLNSWATRVMARKLRIFWSSCRTKVIFLPETWMISMQMAPSHKL